MENIASLLFGCQANRYALSSEHEKAIKYYNVAIEIFPYEYRYFVNRSYCYDQLNKFEMALKDAEMAIKIKPEWAKCHFRRGRALRGLKKFLEAELCFDKVLQLEGAECKEANSELIAIRKQVCINSGCDQQTSNEIAHKCADINQTISTIQEMKHFRKIKYADKRKSSRGVQRYQSNGKVFAHPKPHYNYRDN